MQFFGELGGPKGSLPELDQALSSRERWEPPPPHDGLRVRRQDRRLELPECYDGFPAHARIAALELPADGRVAAAAIVLQL